MAITEEQQSKIKRLGTSFIINGETCAGDYLGQVWATVVPFEKNPTLEDVRVFVQFGPTQKVMIPANYLHKVVECLADMQKKLAAMTE